MARLCSGPRPGRMASKYLHVNVYVLLSRCHVHGPLIRAVLPLAASAVCAAAAAAASPRGPPTRGPPAGPLDARWLHTGSPHLSPLLVRQEQDPQLVLLRPEQSERCEFCPKPSVAGQSMNAMSDIGFESRPYAQGAARYSLTGPSPQTCSVPHTAVKALSTINDKVYYTMQLWV